MQYVGHQRQTWPSGNGRSGPNAAPAGACEVSASAASRAGMVRTRQNAALDQSMDGGRQDNGGVGRVLAAPATPEKNTLPYLLTAEGVKNRAKLTRDYLARKEAEYEALKAEIAALRQAQAEMPGDAAFASKQKA